MLSSEETRLSGILAEAIGNGRVAMIGPIRQELLSGIREPVQFERLRTALQAYRDEPVETSDYEEAGRLFNICRSRGVECGPIDMLICGLAKRHRWQVLTSDATLNRCLALMASEP
jgi:predicted nucleic acid-binding protein